MKTKLMLWIWMAFILISAASAIEMCEDTIELNENCTMVTPIINCTTYDYNITNITDDVVVLSDSLISMGDNKYKFNFTQPEGDYIVTLCDGYTREIKVRPKDDKMIIAAIILIPMLLGLFLLLGANGLGDDHNALRLFLFLLSPIMFIVSLHFGVVALVKFYNFPELQDTIGDTIYWFGLVLGVIISYFIIYLFIKLVHTIAEKKKEKLNY